MKRRLLGTTALAGLIAVLSVSPSQTASEADLIRRAQRMSVHDLDPRLPRIRFDDWLRDRAGPLATFAWEANDCGEATGTATDRGRDLPACVEVFVTLPDRRTARIWLVVGTQRRGPVGNPGLAFARAGSGGVEREFERLADLEPFLRGGPLAPSPPPRPNESGEPVALHHWTINRWTSEAGAVLRIDRDGSFRVTRANGTPGKSGQVAVLYEGKADSMLFSTTLVLEFRFQGWRLEVPCYMTPGEGDPMFMGLLIPHDAPGWALRRDFGVKVGEVELQSPSP